MRGQKIRILLNRPLRCECVARVHVLPYSNTYRYFGRSTVLPMRSLASERARVAPPEPRSREGGIQTRTRAGRARAPSSRARRAARAPRHAHGRARVHWHKVGTLQVRDGGVHPGADHMARFVQLWLPLVNIVVSLMTRGVGAGRDPPLPDLGSAWSAWVVLATPRDRQRPTNARFSHLDPAVLCSVLVFYTGSAAVAQGERSSEQVETTSLLYPNGTTETVSNYGMHYAYSGTQNFSCIFDGQDLLHPSPDRYRLLDWSDALQSDMPKWCRCKSSARMLCVGTRARHDTCGAQTGAARLTTFLTQVWGDGKCHPIGGRC